MVYFCSAKFMYVLLLNAEELSVLLFAVKPAAIMMNIIQERQHKKHRVVRQCFYINKSEDLCFTVCHIRVT
jgi:hypothetical protein